MKMFAMLPLVLLSLTAMSQTATTPQKNVRLETIVRNDTVVQIDTVITTKKIKRTEIVQRMEEVFYTDSISLSGGIPARKIVRVPSVVSPGLSVKTDGRGVTAVPVPVPVVEDVERVLLKDTVYPEIPGGGYLWIPDSLRAAVDRIVKGNAKIIDTDYLSQLRKRAEASLSQPETIDPEELVTFRGDTTRMVLKSRNLGRFDRGLFNYLYIPKGIWSIGATASYGEFSTKDLEVLDLLSDINFSGHIFSIKPYFSYFIGNNRAVGMRLGYTSGKANIGSFNVDIDEDMNFNLSDISYRSENYTAALTYSQYFGITRRGRFSIFNDVELAFSSGNSDFIRPFAGKLKDTHTNTMEVALNFSPGLSVYIMDPVTFNVSFGVFGLHLRNEKQTVDGEDMGSRFTSGANFRFNIFNISFGVAVNL